jgi:hypothetical protein
MVNVTLSVPLLIHRIMKKHREIRWSELARWAIVQKAEELDKESDPIRHYNERRLAQEGEDADEFFDL